MPLPEFATSSPLTMGVELELQLVALSDFDLAPASPDMLDLLSRKPFPGAVTPEITQSMIEVNSSVHTHYAPLVEELRLTREELAAGEMTEDSLNSFFDIVDQSLRIMTTNTQRAAALVRSFKQVAVDQSSGDIRSFNLRAYLNEVLLSLQPKLKGRPIKVEVDCPPDLVMDSYPGAVSQIVTNMVVNSLVHGFERDQPGHIAIRAALEGNTVAFNYTDDGAGMDKESLDKLFDPFFTTKRGSGGSGLGAHILFNLVTGALGCTVQVDSAPGQGLRYSLSFPRSVRVEKLAA